jgi:glycosidase
MRAWLITWEGTSNKVELKNPVVAILSWRYSPERVRRLVEQMYINHTSTISEQMNYARSKKRNPYQAYYNENITWQIYCGHNPHLHAQLVESLCLETDANNRQKLSWIAFPRPESKKINCSVYFSAT